MTEQRILVYHIGSLGDTLATVPALWAVRENFPDAHITMLTDEQPGRALVQPRDILDGSGLIDEYIVYSVGNRLAMAGLLLRLRMRRFSSLLYLIKVYADDRRIRRDRLFFRLAGIKRVIGMDGLPTVPKVSETPFLRGVPHVTDTLLKRLAASGLDVRPNGHGRRELGIGDRELDEVEQWLARLPSSRGRPWVGIGIGGKMAAKIWPLERYKSLVDHLIEAYDAWPVVFGGPENRVEGQALVTHWNRGYVDCGTLGIRATIAAMSKCSLFVGNDTGTMHMAAAAGVRCVGIYSSRDYPGLWNPYGHHHLVLRTRLPCEGCMLEECVEQGMKCILAISVEQVLRACRTMCEETIGAEMNG